MGKEWVFCSFPFPQPPSGPAVGYPLKLGMCNRNPLYRTPAIFYGETRRKNPRICRSYSAPPFSQTLKWFAPGTGYQCLSFEARLAKIRLPYSMEMFRSSAP